MDVFQKIGQDITIIVQPNFTRRLFSKENDISQGPETLDEKKLRERFQKNVLPVFTKKFKDTYRIPKLPMDIKKHIQGYVTGFNPKSINSKKNILVEKILKIMRYSELKEEKVELDTLSEGELEKYYEDLIKRLNKIITEIKLYYPDFNVNRYWDFKGLKSTLDSVKEEIISSIKKKVPNSKVDKSWSVKELLERLDALK